LRRNDRWATGVFIDPSADIKHHPIHNDEQFVTFIPRFDVTEPNLFILSESRCKGG
jgi:hypothetical protein